MFFVAGVVLAAAADPDDGFAAFVSSNIDRFEPSADPILVFGLGRMIPGISL